MKKFKVQSSKFKARTPNYKLRTILLLRYRSTVLSFLLLFFASTLFPAELRVYYISVGQGDATYIELPNGENVLIDGGPNNTNSTTNPLIYFLERKNIKKINHVILSHAHSDHYNGLSPVFDRYEIKSYYDSFIPGSSQAESFRAKARTEPAVNIINTLSFSAGTTFYWCITSTPAVLAVMLHRGDAFGTTPTSDNDTSLVFKIIFGSSTFIFGGDAGGSGGSYKNLEGWLAATYGDGIQSDCYKVHHHGSSSSSDSSFLSVLKPKYAFIGTNGTSYGHPTTAAMDRINVWTSQAEPKIVQAIKDKTYTNIYATYINGNIMVKTTGDGKYEIQTNYVPSPVVVSTTTGGFVDLPSDKTKILSYVNAVNNMFNPARNIGGDDEKFSIEYYLNNTGESTFRVYTIAGKVVYEEKIRNDTTGTQRPWVWDGKNSAGETVAPGAYFVFVKTPDGQSVKRVAVIR